MKYMMDPIVYTINLQSTHMQVIGVNFLSPLNMSKCCVRWFMYILRHGQNNMKNSIKILCEMVKMLCQYITRNGKWKHCQINAEQYGHNSVRNGNNSVQDCWNSVREDKNAGTFKIDSYKSLQDCHNSVQDCWYLITVQDIQNNMWDNQNSMQEGQNSMRWWKMMKILFDKVKLLCETG